MARLGLLGDHDHPIMRTSISPSVLAKAGCFRVTINIGRAIAIASGWRLSQLTLSHADHVFMDMLTPQ
jgi:hypothetical protein